MITMKTGTTNAVGRMASMLFTLATLAILAGCGTQGQGKGPALPYTPTSAKPLPEATIKTEMGDIRVELYEDDCPNIVANFVQLAEKKFYDGLTFHRIVPDFCVQGGCPKGDGSGGPGYRLNDEFYDGYKKNLHGTLAMANSGANTNGSQFFFNIKKDEKGNVPLDGKHVVFGKVLAGMEAVEKLAAVKTNGDRPLNPPKIISIQITKKRDHGYEVLNKVPDKKEEDKKDPAQKTDVKVE